LTGPARGRFEFVARSRRARRPKLLVGWARIAAYLQCAVATAKRREREGLPVVRVGGAVCAFPEEVDTWARRWRARGLRKKGRR